MIIKSKSVVQVKDNHDDDGLQKLIDQSGVKKLIEEAEKEAQNIIAVANYKALKIEEDSKKETDLYQIKRKSEIDKEIERIICDSKEKGFNEGYTKGKEKGREEAIEKIQKEYNALIKEAEDIRDDNKEMRSRLIKDLEADIIDLIQAIFEKIIRKLTEEDVDLIVSLVDKGLENFDMEDKLTIITSKFDYDYLDLKRDEILSKASFVDELDLKYDSEMDRGDLILETSKGSIDVSLAKQLTELKYYLKEILESEE